MAKQEKATKYYRDVETVVCIAPDGVNKEGKPFVAMRGRTATGKLLTVINMRNGVCKVVVTEVSDKPFV